MSAALALCAFNAVGSAAVVKVCVWPRSHWWPVFGLVTFVTAVAWVTYP